MYESAGDRTCYEIRFAFCKNKKIKIISLVHTLWLYLVVAPSLSLTRTLRDVFKQFCLIKFYVYMLERL